MRRPQQGYRRIRCAAFRNPCDRDRSAVILRAFRDPGWQLLDPGVDDGGLRPRVDQLADGLLCKGRAGDGGHPLVERKL